MPIDPNDARHQTHANLELLWSAGSPQVLPVAGAPWCEVRLDPIASVLRLRTDFVPPAPEVSKLRNLSFEAVADGAQEIAELTVTVDDNLHGVYGLITTIADELQLAAVPLADAVSAGLAQFKDVLTARAGLSEQHEIGLFGEVLFLEFLINALDAGTAIQAWQGASSAEHDFVFADLHIEVKTTSTERRRHQITSLSQLVPLPDVPLSLLSIQLTRASVVTGQTLSQAIARVAAKLMGHSATFAAALEFRGWRLTQADLYSTHWVLRSSPRAYRVDAGFPSLTPQGLASVVPQHDKLSDVSYRVDVTDLNHHTLPEPLAGFAESERAAT